jgi:hypothetical protein
MSRPINRLENLLSGRSRHAWRQIGRDEPSLGEGRFHDGSWEERWQEESSATPSRPAVPAAP